MWLLIVSLSDVEFLRKGIIKTSKDEANTLYTISLVGEIGVGTSSVLELIANVPASNDTGHDSLDILDDPINQSQTNSARIYELTSKNGIVVSTNIREHRGCA